MGGRAIPNAWAITSTTMYENLHRMHGYWTDGQLPLSAIPPIYYRRMHTGVLYVWVITSISHRPCIYDSLHAFSIPHIQLSSRGGDSKMLYPMHQVFLPCMQVAIYWWKLIEVIGHACVQCPAMQVVIHGWWLIDVIDHKYSITAMQAVIHGW